MFLSAKTAQQISNDDTVWIDICADHATGWVRGAHLVAFDDIVESSGDTGGLLPSIERLNAALAGTGIGSDRRIIIYDDQNNLCASRLAWTLIECGLESVFLIDGGQKALVESGLEFTQEATPEDDRKVELAYQGQHCCRADDILSTLEDPSCRPLDARSKAEYLGTDVRSRHGGHIPGAIHLDWQECVSPDDPAYLKPRPDLVRLLKERGIKPGQTLYLYCQTHRRSSLVFCILRMLGYRHIKGYPGAWSDWGNRDDLPHETSVNAT